MAQAKKTSSKKAAAKATATKKTPAKKVAAKKPAAKKDVVKKAAIPKKAAVEKKAVVKKSPAKKAAAKKLAPKKALTSNYEDEAPAPQKVTKPGPFNAVELQEWQDLLVRRRMEVSGDIKNLVRDAMDSEDGHTMPTHQADRGSDVDLQDLSLGMLGDEETLLWQIDRALSKLKNNSPIAFGLCEHNHNPIPLPRLRLLPWTPLSIEGASYMEDNGLTLHDMIIDA